MDDNFTVTPQLLSRRMVFINLQLEQFWIRWKKEYLLELREAHRVNISNSPDREWAKVGDIVVIHNDDKRRGFWSTGRIEELLMEKNEKVRAAIVRVYTGQKRSRLLNRPVQKLYPIEINCKDGDCINRVEEITNEIQSSESVTATPIESDSAEIEEMPEIADPEPITRRRSKRAAAVAARNTIKAQSLI